MASIFSTLEQIQLMPLQRSLRSHKLARRIEKKQFQNNSCIRPLDVANKSILVRRRFFLAFCSRRIINPLTLSIDRWKT